MASSTTSVRPEDVIRRIGDTNERALAYVLDPDPQLTRLSRKIREAIITDLPPVTAGALLGPAALARHFIASAASGRYRDLFPLWQLFRLRPDDCRPILAERQRALEKARVALGTAVRLGLSGHAERVAEDVQRAEGLIWQWLRESLVAELPAVGQRPVIASALLVREPDLAIPLPPRPDDRWLAEAAEARAGGPLAPQVEALLAGNADRLPATIATLSLAWEHYPERVPELVSRIDLSSPSIGALMAWARDHGVGERVVARVRDLVERDAATSRAEGAATWYAWRQRGVDVELPAPLRPHTLEGLDVSRPESAALAAELVAEGAQFDMQKVLAELASRNRQLAEKAYEAFVCAGLDVRLPLELESNPLVKEGTRCPWCQSWTYVRAGHERRCPRRPAAAPLTAPEAPAEPTLRSGDGGGSPAPDEPGEDAAPELPTEVTGAEVQGPGPLHVPEAADTEPVPAADEPVSPEPPPSAAEAVQPEPLAPEKGEALPDSTADAAEGPAAS